MFSGSSELFQKSLQMKQDHDKLMIFSKALSRESSVANPSLRVYYGGASGAVPFMWESSPGTPKHHTLSDSTALVPPLTPPPSYYRSSNKKSVKKNNSRSNLFYALFPKISLRKTNASPSLTSASFSSSDSSLFSPITTTKLKGIRKRFLSQSSSFDSREDHDDGTIRSPTSTLCFGIVGKVLASGGGLRCCYGRL